MLCLIGITLLQHEPFLGLTHSPIIADPQVLLTDLAQNDAAEKGSESSSVSMLINHCDRHGDSSLHVAASRGEVPIVKVKPTNYFKV